MVIFKILVLGVLLADSSAFLFGGDGLLSTVIDTGVSAVHKVVDQGLELGGKVIGGILEPFEIWKPDTDIDHGHNEGKVTKCPAIADVIFVMDASGSIGSRDFYKELDFATRLTEHFKIGSNDVRFGAVVYSDTAKKMFDLEDYSDHQQLAQALRTTPYFAKGTKTYLGLELVRSSGMFHQTSGGRASASKIVIVLTDGQSDRMFKTLNAADALKDEGVEIISVGIGAGLGIELNGMASGGQNVYKANSFESLNNIEQTVARRTCEIPQAAGNVPIEKQDFDRCRDKPCEQICTSYSTGFVCSCQDGFKVSPTDSTKCQDIDECQDSENSPCEHSCVNTVGGYRCSCPRGYAVSPSDPSKCQDIDECSTTYRDTPPCEQICVNTKGGYRCSCREGYVISATNPAKCDDIDECQDSENSPCEHSCVNTVGGYRCACPRGYAVSPSDPSKCQDIDECSTTYRDTPPCEQICVNTKGGYRCSCREGYVISATNPAKCDDIDECQDSENSPCEHSCVNTVGGYRCSCPRGYAVSPSDPSKCQDIDECSTTYRDTPPCEQICVNTKGGYRCSCREGYVINATNPAKCDVVKRCHVLADVILLIDSSGSIAYSNYEKQLEFLSRLTHHFQIGPSDVRFAAIVFSNDAEKLFDLRTYSDPASLSQALKSAPYQTGSTFTNKALTLIEGEKMFRSDAGGRDGAAKLVIVFTDGNSSRPDLTLPAADRLKSQGVKILAVGIGDIVSDQELTDMASEAEDVFKSDSFQLLEYIEQRVADRTCGTRPA